MIFAYVLTPLEAQSHHGATVRDIYRSLRFPQKPVIEALKALEADQQVERFLYEGGERGSCPEAYRLAENLIGMARDN